MKNKCGKCQYQRDEGFMDNFVRPPAPEGASPQIGSADLGGSGKWCSNSKSPLFQTRVADDASCDFFVKCGKKAPLWMRLANKGLEKLNRQDAKNAKKKTLRRCRRGRR